MSCVVAAPQQAAFDIATDQVSVPDCHYGREELFKVMDRATGRVVVDLCTALVPKITLPPQRTNVFGLNEEVLKQHEHFLFQEDFAEQLHFPVLSSSYTKFSLFRHSLSVCSDIQACSRDSHETRQGQVALRRAAQ